MLGEANICTQLFGHRDTRSGDARDCWRSMVSRSTLSLLTPMRNKRRTNDGVDVEKERESGSVHIERLWRNGH
jgi:hypothetical protein